MRPKNRHFINHDSTKRLVVANSDGLEMDDAALHRLEELDDAIFAALDGDPAALDRLGDLWDTVHREVDTPFVHESREVYSHHARKVLSSSAKCPKVSESREQAALHVLDLVDPA